jgi:methyltransferase family protein
MDTAPAPPPPIARQLVDYFFAGLSPFAGFDASVYPLDLQGWGSNDPNFADVIAEIRPSFIIEMGSWKGGSAIHMAGLCARLRLNTVILCVDTWLGATEHWYNKENPDFFKSLNLKNGYPQIYYQFLANVVHSKLEDRILPLPMPSVCAARLLRMKGIQADLVYVDASHDELDVTIDLVNCYPLVRPGGILFGDDYQHCPGVTTAVNRFRAADAAPVAARGRQWIIRRNAAAVPVSISPQRAVA